MGRRALTLPELLALIAAVCLIALFTTPLLTRAHISANEATALAVLQEIGAAQEAYRLQAITDQDRDGLGEYGFLQELTATADPRGRGGPAPARTLARDLLIERGVGRFRGYHFLVYLPTASAPTAEQATLGEAVAADADRQERRYVVYAWPVRYGSTGKRAFAIDPRGVVVATANVATAYSGRERVPRVNAAFEARTHDGTLDADLGGEPATTGDGQRWLPLE